jgi:hypothetical protein
MNILEGKTKTELLELVNSLETELQSKKTRIKALSLKKEVTDEDTTVAEELSDEVGEIKKNIDLATKELSRKNEIERINGEKIQKALKETKLTLAKKSIQR